MTAPDHVAAHRHSSGHRPELLRSQACGCFHCCRTFAVNEIAEWTDNDAEGIGQTALCPRCGVDAVIGDASGYSVANELLTTMKVHWF